MAAIITDQIRILNARNFLSGITTTGSSYYSFIGLPNATDISSVWDNDPPAPVDNFDNENQIWDTMIGLKKITSSDTRLVVPKIEWRSGNTFDMYRHDYSTSNTIAPGDIVKFDSTNYIPVPGDWGDSTTNAAVRDNAVDGSIKTVVIKNRGVALGTANAVYTNVPIKGSGTGAECTITMNADSQVESVVVSSQGSGYTWGNVDLVAGGVPVGTTRPVLDVVISPQGGHGADIYRELGAKNVLMYSRFENDIQNPDFITGNQIARVGIVQAPNTFGTNTPLSLDKASAVTALRLTGIGYSSATYDADSFVTQTVGTGITAVEQRLQIHSMDLIRQTLPHHLLVMVH